MSNTNEKIHKTKIINTTSYTDMTCLYQCCNLTESAEFANDNTPDWNYL